MGTGGNFLDVDRGLGGHQIESRPEFIDELPLDGKGPLAQAELPCLPETE